MKFRSILIFIFILISLPPAFYVNKILKNFLQPKKTLARLLLYVMLAFALVFIYTFFWVWIILHLFPVQMK
jgi:hypothetical protein